MGSLPNCPSTVKERSATVIYNRFDNQMLKSFPYKALEIGMNALQLRISTTHDYNAN
jgi:hypothetical protein